MGTLVEYFGDVLDLGPCLVGKNLNLLSFRGFAPLEYLTAVSAADVFDQVTNKSGTQRELSSGHVKDCFRYAQEAPAIDPSVDPRAFPEVILNVRDLSIVEVYELDDPENVIDINSMSDELELETSVVGIRVRVRDLEFPAPTKDPQISRVDGNHRLSGVNLEEFLTGSPVGVDELIPASFCVYVGLNVEQEVKLFRDINGEHKGMDVNHLTNVVIQLAGAELRNDPKRLPTWLAHELAQDGRAFHQMVFYGGSRSGVREEFGRVPPVKIKTLSATVKLTLSKADVTRSWLGHNPDKLLELLDNYWSAVRAVFVDEWNDQRGYILLQAIGLSGFAQLGAHLMDTLIQTGAYSEGDFRTCLAAVKSEVDLSRTNEQWSGIAGAGGGNRVAEALIAASTRDNVMRTKVLEGLGPEVDAAAQLDDTSHE